MSKFKQGDIVEYDYYMFKGKGKVVGTFPNLKPDVYTGKHFESFVIEDLSANIPTKGYEYTHFVCPEKHLKLKVDDNVD